MPQDNSIEPLGYRPEDAARLLGVCRGTVYNLLRDNRLESFQVGRSRLIKTTSIKRLIGEAA